MPRLKIQRQWNTTHSRYIVIFKNYMYLGWIQTQDTTYWCSYQLSSQGSSTHVQFCTPSLLVLLLSGPDKVNISAVHIPAVTGDSCFQDGRSEPLWTWCHATCSEKGAQGNSHSGVGICFTIGGTNLRLTNIECTCICIDKYLCLCPT